MSDPAYSNYSNVVIGFLGFDYENKNHQLFWGSCGVTLKSWWDCVMKNKLGPLAVNQVWPGDLNILRLKNARILHFYDIKIPYVGFKYMNWKL